MTRATLLGFVIMGLALAGLAIAQFAQPEPPSYAGDIGVDDSGGRSRRDDGKVAALERKVLTLEADLDTHRTEIRDLRSALAALDANMPAPAAEGEAPVAKAPVPADLERHFQTFMSKYEEEKAARDRRAWAERAASGFLRRVENVSDDQRKAFTNYVVAYWDERRKITREKYPTPEERQAATEALAAERNVKLQEIFDPAQYAQVSEMFGWMDRSGGRTPRGNRPRR